jgi:Bacterial Ig-like domain (group 3)/FG-GAP-like repeat
MATTSRLVQAVKISSRAIWTKVCDLVCSTGDSGAIAAVKGTGRLWPPTASAVVLALSVLSAVAAQSQTVTITLTVSPSTGVRAGDEVTLTGTALVNGSSCFLCGSEIQFLDSSVQPHLIGKATPAYGTNSTTASVKVRFGTEGTHSITAYLPNNQYNSNTYTSAATVLTVGPPRTPYLTYTTLGAATGTVGNYTLAASIWGYGLAKPTGTMSFQDASNSSSLLGTGALTSPSYSFQTGVQSGAVVDGPSSIAVGDFNNDGFPDLAILNSSDDTASVYLGNGNGTFGSAITFDVGHASVAMVAADPLGTGNLGLIVASTSPAQIQWFEGDGSGHMTSVASHGLNHQPSQLILGCEPSTWDGSVCSVSQASGIIEMYQMTTTPGFYAVNSLNGVSGDWIAVNGISGTAVTSDFNKTGILDLAYGNTSSKVVVLYPSGVGTSVTTTSAVSPVGAPPVAMVAGDFNNDGYPDIAVATQSNGLWIMLNNGKGGFNTPAGIYALSNPGPIVTGDFNGDGNLDLAMQQPGYANNILIFYGNGAGGFSPAPQSSIFDDLAYNNGTLAIGDFNVDGLPDLVATPDSSNTYAFSIVLGQQTETASASGLIAYGNSAQNADATYTPGSNDSWATSTSSTTPLQGIYATFAQAPPVSLTAGTAPGTIKVQVNGNSALLSSFTGSVQLTVVAPNATSQVYTQSAVAGVATFSAVAAPTQGGTYQYIANLAAGNTASESVANEAVGGGVAAKLAFNPGMPNPSVTAVAGNASVSAEDSYGNIATGFTGTVTLSSSDSAATFSPSPYTFVAGDNGTHTFAVTFHTAGTQSLTAASTGLTSVVQSGIEVTSSVATTTFLGLSAASVTAKTVVTVTAIIKSGSIPVTLGTVNFYDSLAIPTLLGSAQLNSSGNAVFRYRPSIGASHTITATYVANKFYPTSTTTQPLAVTAAQDYTTATTIAATGTVGNYSLSSTLTAYGFPAPTGNVSFEDTSNGNAVLATATLGAATQGFIQGSNTLTASSTLDGIAYGDFNNDGILDLAVPNYNSATVSIFLGVGDGTFSTATNVAVGSGPDFIATGDFNSDGNLDLAVLNYNDSTVTVLKGNGSGGFMPFAGSPIALGSNPSTVAVGDFNRDGTLDLAIAGNSNQLQLFAGNGSGGFSALLAYVTSGTFLEQVGMADLVGNGDLDLVFVEGNPAQLGWALGNGNGTFGTEHDLAAGSTPYALVLADFTGSGVIDAAVLNAASAGNFMVYLNNGSGTFTLKATVATDPYPGAFVAADFNGDGHLDMAVEDGNGGFRIFQGAGDGTFTSQALIGGAIQYGPMVAGDFSGDGRPDVAVVDGYYPDVYIFLGAQTITSSSATAPAIYGSSNNVVASYVPGTSDAYGPSASSPAALAGLYLTYSAVPATPILVGGAPGTVTVQVNANSAIVSGSTAGITLTVTAPNATVATYTANAVAGVATFSALAAPTQAGTYVYNANFTAAASNILGLATANEAVGAVTATKLIFTTPFPSSTNSGTPSTVVVTAETAAGNTFTAFTGTVTLSSSDQFATFVPQNYAYVAADNGAHSFAVTFNTGGTQTLTASSSSLTPAQQTGIAVDFVGTTTTLNVLSTPIAPATVVTMTATVENASSVAVTTGRVNFYDVAATPKLIGSASLSSAGTATFRLRPGSGSHQFYAAFQKTTLNLGSTSITQDVVVNLPTTAYPTTNTLIATGTSLYQLTGTLSAPGKSEPSGTMTFVDTSNGNALLGTGGFATPDGQGFAPDVVYTGVGSTDKGLVEADFNNDGIPDLAITNVNGTLSIFLGNGDGTFQTVKGQYTIGTGTYDVVAGDFNGDGNIDLATANGGSNNISVLLGNGDGTFQTPATYAAGTTSRTMVMGDFNNDGILDLATANGGANTVTVFLGVGNGTFTTKGTYAVGTSPYGITVADYNQDGNLDIATSNYGSSNVTILLGAGDGTFTTKGTYAVGANPIGIASGVFTSNGIPDLAVDNFGSTTVTILLGAGDGTFPTSKGPYTVGSNPSGVSVVDINGDGKLDLVVANFGSNNITVLSGNGDGTFQTLNTLAVGGNPVDTAVLDLNGDGRPDIVSVDSNSNQFSVLLNQNQPVATLANVTLYGNTAHNVMASYTSGSGDSFASANSATQSLNGIYLSYNVAPVSSAPPTAATAIKVQINAAGALVATATNSILLTVTGPNSYSQTYGPTAAVAGIATFNAASITPEGAYVYTATFPGEGTAGQVVATQYVSASAQQLAITTAYPASTLQGAAHALTVTIEDASGNTVATFTGTVTLTSSDTAASFVPSASYTYVAADAGSHTFPSITLNTVGTQTLTASSSGLAAATESGIAVTGYSTTTTLFTGPASPAVSSTIVTVAANVIDSNGNPVPTGTVNFYDSGATPTLIGTRQLSGGLAYMRFRPGAGGHGFTATFVANASYPGSTSAVSTFVVSAATTSSATSTTIAAASGNPSGYGLTGTFTYFGKTVPSGTLSFLDTSNANASLGTGTLSATAGTNFTGNANINTGSNPRGIAVGDFNNDGYLDVATANATGNSISIALGTASGVFPGTADFTIPSTSPYGIGVGDFNGDGILDVAVVSNGGTNAFVYLGNGDGTFNTTPSATMTTPTNGQGVAVGDFNHDGKLDLAVTSGTSNLISIFLGNGDGTFPTTATFSFTANGATDIATADFDGDGNLDLAWAGGSNDNFGVAWGDGTGKFVTPTTFALTGGYSNQLAVGYFNGDSKLDIVAETSNDINPFLGTGTRGSGAFTAQTVVASSWGSDDGIAAADFNGDGNLDVAMVVNGGVAVYPGNGTGNFGTPTGYSSGWGGQIAVGDFNGDGLPDIATSGGGNYALFSVILNEQTRTATASGISFFGNSTHNVDAKYTGNANYAGSQSAVILETVTATGAATTTSITTSNPSIALGTAVTFTATVAASAGTPAGTVDFFDNNAFLGTAALNSSGIASLTTSALPAGAQSIYAAYSGSATYANSQSAAILETVASSAPSGNLTTLNLEPSDTTSILGSALTFYATAGSATPGTLTGTVSFFDGTNFLGSAPVNSQGTAAFTVSSLTVGTHTISSVYSGDPTFTGSTSAAVEVLVLSLTGATTSTTLVTSNPNITINSAVTFTATVASSTAGTPSGTVIFSVDNVQVGTQPLTASSASFTTSALTAGTHEVQANYSGDSTFDGSNNNLIETVNTSGTLATFTSVQTSNASVPAGSAVTFTGTVTHIAIGTPTGTISFFDGHSFLLTQPLPATGVAFATTTLPAGTYSVYSSYSGDASFSGSTATPVLQTITPTGMLPTSATLTTPNLVVGAGATIVFTANVLHSNPGTPSGTLDLVGNGAVVDQSTVPPSGVVIFTENSTNSGAQSYTVVYSGDTVFAGSTSSPLAFTVATAPSTTTLTVAATSNPATKRGDTRYRDSGNRGSGNHADTTTPPVQALTANVASKGTGVNSGRVYFYDGASVIGSQFLNRTGAGVTSVNTVLGPGSHAIKASFAGTNRVSPSSSAASTVVTQGSLSSVLALSGTPGNYTLTATLTGNTVTIPSGPVTFLDQTSGKPLGTVQITSGNATSLLPAAPGSPFSAGGDPSFIVAGDFDGDGNADVAIANYATGTLTVLLGDGTGLLTASPQSPIPLGANPTGLATGDFNNDGKTGIAVATNSGKVIILVGDANGNFTPAIGSPLTANSNAFIAEGDFNGDGIDDLVVADSSGAGSITVLLGKGSSTFSALTPVLMNSPSSIVVANFDSDGKPDLAITNSKVNQVTVLLGNGDGTFQAAPGSPYSTGSNPVFVVSADFNSDGNPDLAIANDGSANVTVLLGDGTGKFAASPGSPLAVGNGPVWLVAADPTGTGILDLFVVNSTDATTTVLVGNTTGTFTAAPGSPFAIGGIAPTALLLEDLTNDGRLDFVVLERASNQVTVSLNVAKAVSTVILSSVSVVGAGAGSNTVVANYSGDALYPAVISNPVNLETVSTADFSVTSATATQTVQPGAAASYTIAVTPANGFDSAVTLTATGLPAGATAVFTPASVTPNGSGAVQSTLVIQTAASASAAATTAALRPAGNSTGWPLGLALAGFPLVGIVVLGRRRRIGSRWLGWAFAVIVLIGLLGLGGCGSGSGFFGPPATTYTITVTATSGSLQHSTAVTLTIK